MVTQSELDELSQTLIIKYKFLSNVEEDCPDKEGKEVAHCYGAEITLSNPSDNMIHNWALHYSQVYPAYASQSNDFTLEHLNGDIHQIKPKANFEGFEKGIEK